MNTLLILLLLLGDYEGMYPDKEDYINGDGVAQGTLDMNGEDIVTDLDGDSRWEHGTDDQLTLYLNSSLVMSFLSTGLQLEAGGIYNWNGRSEITSPADGKILLTNDAGTAFSALQFGGTTSSFPALFRSGTSLQVAAADGSGFTKLQAATFEATAFGMFNWTGRSAITSPADGYVLMTDNAATGFTSLQFGGSSTSYPSLVRNGTDLEVKLADSSARTGLLALTLSASNSGYHNWVGRSRLYSASDGNIMLSDNAATDFGLLQFGGTTSSFPAWKRNGTAMEARLADDSARAVVQAASLTLDSHTVGIEIEAGSAILGPSAPTWAESTSQTVGGLLFDADADEVYIQFEVPDCWVGNEDLTLKIYWTNSAGNALADTNTVKWDITYGSIVWGTEAAGNGTEETGTATYTQSGAGADGDTHITEIALDYDSTDQPIYAGDDITIHFDRDVSGDSYGSGAIVAKWEVEFSSVGICNHY